MFHIPPVIFRYGRNNLDVHFYIRQRVMKIVVLVLNTYSFMHDNHLYFVTLFHLFPL